MVSYQLDDLLVEIENLKVELSEVKAVRDYYQQQEKEFITKMAAIVLDYQSRDQ